MKPKKRLCSIKDKSSRRTGSSKKSKSSLHYWLVWMLMLVLFFIFLFIFGENGLLQIGELKKLDFSLAEEIGGLIKENEALKKEIKGLRDDPFYIEKVAREDLDLVKPNEIVYHFVTSETDNER